MDDEAAAALEQVWHDSARGPVWWHDPAASPNLVRHDLAEPLAGTHGLADAGTAMVGGRMWSMVAGEVTMDIPTTGAYYSLTAHGAAPVTVTTTLLGADRSPIGTPSSTTGTGVITAGVWSGWDGGIRVTVSGEGWSGLQVSVPPADGFEWSPGRGLPQVRIVGLSEQLLWSLRDGETAWEGASVRLVEVHG